MGRQGSYGELIPSGNRQKFFSLEPNLNIDNRTLSSSTPNFQEVENGVFRVSKK